MAIYCKPQNRNLIFLILILFLSYTNLLYGFEQGKLKLAGQNLKIEIAYTEAEQAQGLMRRKKLENNQGMLFVFTDERVRNFWMKNTFIDLDILFFDSKQELVDKVTLLGIKSEMQLQIPQYTSKKAAKYVLEVPAGWASTNHLLLGSRFTLFK